MIYLLYILEMNITIIYKKIKKRKTDRVEKIPFFLLYRLWKFCGIGDGLLLWLTMGERSIIVLYDNSFDIVFWNGDVETFTAEYFIWLPFMDWFDISFIVLFEELKNVNFGFSVFVWVWLVVISLSLAGLLFWTFDFGSLIECGWAFIGSLFKISFI